MGGMTFLAMFLVLIALIAIVPFWLRRYHIHRIVAIMIVGIVIGPHAFNLIGRLNHFLGRGFPTDQLYMVVDVIGLLGLIFLMSLAGMEADLSLIRKEKKAVAWLSLLTFFIPAITGFLIYYIFQPKHLVGQLVYASLFASHAVAIVFPIIRELKITRTRFGVAILASTLITDIGSLVLLAVCVQMQRHIMPVPMADSISVFDRLSPAVFGNWFYLFFLFTVVAFIGLSLWIVPLIGEKLFSRLHANDDTRLTFFLLSVLTIVILGELIGINIVVGAFIAGMALARVREIHKEERILHHKLEGLGYGFVVPFLFLSIGMKTNIPILFEAWGNAVIVLLTLLGLLVSKIGSGWLALKISGFDNAKGLCAGLMTVPQLTATLAAATIALQLEMITIPFFNAIVFLSLATTIPIPTLVRLLIIKKNIKFNKAEFIISATATEDLMDDDERVL
jgi:Kef-type K+ transport system membrane component KefB